jgi:RNA-directed DNA polymerase
LKNLETGKCKHYGLIFKEDDILEIDHFLTKILGGKELISNINLLQNSFNDKKVN